MVFYPWYSSTPIDYGIAVAVLRFERQPDGNAWLDARWSVGDGHGTIFLNRDVHFSRPAGSPAETAAALSELTGDLSREIAAALREVDATRKR
jgi:uncharacterized lipoprotein YmbA